MRRKRARTVLVVGDMNKLALATMVLVALTGCSLDGDDDDTREAAPTPVAEERQSPPAPAVPTAATVRPTNVLKTRH